MGIDAVCGFPEGSVLCYVIPLLEFRRDPKHPRAAPATASPHENATSPPAAVFSDSTSTEPETAPENRRFAMKVLSFIGAFAIIVAVGAVVFFFGGFYNVAATEPDPGVVAWALGYIRDASINRHAVDRPPVSMDDPATIQAGARAFASRGCTSCHGGPGVMWAKFSEGLRPDPPDLKEETRDLTPAQVFWIVRNGINMTGMPGFGLIKVSDQEIWMPDQEIWTIAAFIKKLPDISEDDYKAWTADLVPPAGETAPPK